MGLAPSLPDSNELMVRAGGQCVGKALDEDPWHNALTECRRNSESRTTVSLDWDKQISGAIPRRIGNSCSFIKDMSPLAGLMVLQ
jgi:hypothetical protein